MRRTLPLTIIGLVALTGCTSAGEPAETAPPTAEAETSAPTPLAEPTDTAPAETATADPQPSEIAGAPYRIEDEAILGAYSIDDIPVGEPFVAWGNTDATLVHVIGAGSSSTTCQPTAESIEVDDGMLEIEFEWDESSATVACTADLRIFGWAFPVAGADASITQAVVEDWNDDETDDDDDDDEITVEIRPAIAN
ncbi:hypothetical protein [Agrococcus sp. ProA11]|uniref:hypothetical protein n=1 Tax=Agrococcus chionoecetis TaxID=3153752 RepID=UPI0032605B9B